MNKRQKKKIEKRAKALGQFGETAKNTADALGKLAKSMGKIVHEGFGLEGFVPEGFDIETAKKKRLE